MYRIVKSKLIIYFIDNELKASTILAAQKMTAFFLNPLNNEYYAQQTDNLLRVA